MTNIRRKHILCKIHDISHGENTTCKLCKKPNKYCNEDNCYTTASFNFKIDDRPIECKNHKENNMMNVKRKYIVNNNSKITYKKGYICENKKGGSIKNNKKSKNNYDKKSYKNITDEFNEIGNFTLDDDYKKLVKMAIKIMIIKTMIIKIMIIKIMIIKIMIIKIMIIKIMIIKIMMMMIKNQINVNLKIVMEKPHIVN